MIISGGANIDFQSGKVENTGTGNALELGLDYYYSCNESSGATATISGATISAKSGSAVLMRTSRDEWGNTGKSSLAVTGGTISATTGYAINNETDSKITISGTSTKVTSANVTNSQGTIYLPNTGTATADRLEITGGTVENTGNNGNSRVIYNAGTGGIRISGGTVQSTGAGDAIFNASTGAINVSGGTISATSGRGIRSQSTATITITGGTLKATSGYAVTNDGTGTYNISGGTIQATTGYAIWNQSTGKINISGTAKVTSANVTNSQGTIFLRSDGTATADRLTITAGTVENTADTTSARTIYNASTGGVTISGGTVQGKKGYTIMNNSTAAIKISNGTVQATSATGRVVHNASSGTVTISGGTVRTTEADGITIMNNSSGTVTVNGGTVSATTGAAIRNNVDGIVNISGGTIQATAAAGRAVHNSNGAGKVTVSGTATLTSVNTSTTQGTILLSNDASNTAENLLITGGTVENTASNANAVAIRNITAGKITINNGKILAKDGNAIYNSGTGALAITGGFVFAHRSSAISGTYTTPSGSPVILGWDKAAGNTAYTVLTSTDISVAPAPATASWKAPNGIAYANSTNTGFIAIEGVTVGKLTTSFPSHTAVNATYSPTLKLSDITLNAGYAFATPSTPLAVANSGQTFPAIYTDPSGNYEPVNGNITVNVAKAQITKPAVLNTDLLYTGTELYAGIAPNPAYTVTGDKQTAVGNYTASVVLNDKANYEWTDLTTTDLSLPWSIARATGAFPHHNPLDITYSPNLKLSDLPLNTNFAWVNPNTPITNAGNGQTFPATYTDPTGQFNAITGNITVNVEKATVAFDTPTALNATYSTTLKLSDLTLPTGYAWETPATSLNAGDGQRFTATYTDPSGNYNSTSGPVTVNIAKATYTAAITWPTASPITYGQPLSASSLTGSSGAGTFAWTNGAIIPNVTNGGYSVTFTPTNANYNNLTQNVAITVGRASTGLTATPPATIMVSSTNSNANIFNLSTIALSKSDHGTLTYALSGSTTGTILTDLRIINETNLRYTGNGSASGTSTQAITIKSQNYADITVTINFEATSKTSITIGGLSKQDATYDGTPKRGVAGTATSGSYTGELVYTYSGSGIDGTSSARPTNAGNYTLTISIPEDNETYTGSTTYAFTIAKATATPPAGLNATYGQTLADVTLPEGWEWIGALSTPVGNAGARKHNANFAGDENRELRTNVELSINVRKAATPFVPYPSPVNATYTPTLTLSDILLDNGYIWNAPSTELNAGEEQSFAATYTDPTGNYTGTGTITISIAKATPTSAILSGTITATEGQTLSQVALPEGWEWATPTASVGAIGERTHKANCIGSNNYNPAADIDVTITVTSVSPIRQPQIANNNIRIKTSGNTIVLENLPRNAKVQIYSLQGKQIYSAHSDNSQILRIVVQTKGMYIVKAGNQTTRITVR
jgi:hypothetical protein